MRIIEFIFSKKKKEQKEARAFCSPYICAQRAEKIKHKNLFVPHKCVFELRGCLKTVYIYIYMHTLIFMLFVAPFFKSVCNFNKIVSCMHVKLC